MPVRAWFRLARLVALAVAGALVVALAAPDPASGWHEEGAWVEPLLDRTDYTVNVARGDGYLVWTEAGVCCSGALAYALGADFMPEQYLRTFKTMLRTPGGDIVQLSRTGKWTMAGGIDRGVLAYATGESHGEIRLLDLKTRKHRRLPRGVNTPRVEYHPTISGQWLLFGRVRPSERGYLWADTEVVLTNLKTGRSRILATGKNYRTYAYPGQVNGDWVSFTACKFNKYGPNCGVSRYQISTRESVKADLDGSCCAHGDPHTESYMGAGNVSASSVTEDGLVYLAFSSGQNTSWCSYSEVWAWDTQGRLAYMFGVKEDDYGDSNYDEPLAGLVVSSLYVDDSEPHEVVLSGKTTHEDHGYDCDLESSALYVMHRGEQPASPATPSPSPSPTDSEPPTPSPTPDETQSPTPTPAPTPTPSPSPTPTPTPCPLPICL